MAKKTFNVKSTLSVQPKQFSVDDVERAIEQIHEAKAPTSKLPKAEAVEPTSIATKNTVTRRREVMEPEAPVRKVRLSVDINPATHKRLKIKAIEQDSDIMHYVEMLIERDLAY